MSELFGKVARDRLDVHADLGVRGGERDYELRRMGDGHVELGREIVSPRADGLGLAVLVGPYLNIGVTPARLMEILEIAPDSLLYRDAPEKPFRTPGDRALHLRGLASFGSVQDDVA